MFCRKCGAKLPDDAVFCTDCGAEVVKINAPEESKAPLPAAEKMVKENPLNKAKQSDTAKKVTRLPKEYRIIAAVAAAFILIAAIVLIDAGNVCKDPGCDGKAEYGDYCGYHVCMYPGCESKREGESYCWLHQEMTKPNAENDLVISSVSLDHGYSMTTVDARITNNGNKTYSFVKVKGSFENSYGTVLDTDWTYAVGAEGLAPGESATFSMYVDLDYSIRNCDFTITDYDYE